MSRPETREERIAREWDDLAIQLGYHDGGRTATPSDVGYQLMSDQLDAQEHINSPRICEGCGEPLATKLCETCGGSGLVGSLDGMSGCDVCGGAGTIHVGCVQKSYAELAALDAQAITGEDVA